MIKLAKFKVDCTPPVGIPVGFGIGKKTVGVRDPLWFRGIIIDDGKQKVLIASLDYCGIMNKAYDQLVNELADAIGESPASVIVHCIHQHDAPLIDLELSDLFSIETFPESWWKSVVAECARTAKNALADMVEFTHVGHAECRLHGYASNRRIIDKEGRFQGSRCSRCQDETLRNKPVGTIDPFLRTVAFLDGKANILTSMNFYATHPQVANSGKLFSADAPGEAMRLVGSNFPDSFPCFFTGAGGNISAGKYTSCDDLDGNLLKFGKVLADGIIGNLKSLEIEECTEFQILSENFEFPKREVDKLVMGTAFSNEKLCQAVVQSSAEYEKNSTYCTRMLQTGNIRIVFLPGEPFVEYQLYLQSLISDEFIALAANCCDNFLYLPTVDAFKEGGYEPGSFCWCSPEIEKKLKYTLKTLIHNAENCNKT